MIDLEIKDNGEVVLNRDVKTGEKITYQNNYLKSVNEIGYAEVLEDLSRDSELVSGYYSKGKTVVIADESTEDCLIIKRINQKV